MDEDTRQHIAALEQQIRRLEYVLGGLTNRPAVSAKDLFYGYVVDHGPNAEPNLTGNRYWVQVCDVGNTDADVTSAITFTDRVDEGTPPLHVIVAVANLSEPDASHSLAVNTKVAFWMAPAAAPGAQTRFVTNAGGLLPTPRPLYSVLMAINADEDVAFDGPRFQ